MDATEKGGRILSEGDKRASLGHLVGAGYLNLVESVNNGDRTGTSSPGATELSAREAERFISAVTTLLEGHSSTIVDLSPEDRAELEALVERHRELADNAPSS